MQKLRDKLLGEFKKEVTPKELQKYNDDRLNWAKETDDKLLKYIDNVKANDPATMKMLAEYDPNKIKYNSARGQFQSGNKFGALSDFKDQLKKEDSSYQEKLKNFANFHTGKPYKKPKQEEKLFQNILPRLKAGNKKKPLSDIDLIFEVASPKEKMSMRNRYKDYDFTQRKLKEDIKEVKKVEPQTIPAPIAPTPVPQQSVGEIIRERAAAREATEKKAYVKRYGNLGLGGLGFRREFGE